MQKCSLSSSYARNHLSKEANGKITQFFADGRMDPKEFSPEEQAWMGSGQSLWYSYRCRVCKVMKAFDSGCLAGSVKPLDTCLLFVIELLYNCRVRAIHRRRPIARAENLHDLRSRLCHGVLTPHTQLLSQDRPYQGIRPD
jgi:hypothetical protein